MAALPEPSAHASLPPRCSEQMIRVELRKLMESRSFVQANRLARFLSFIVEHFLRGETERLKETVIGVEVYDRPPDYDPKVDAIVRTEARRLRRKLQEYYSSEGKSSPLVISVPIGGYVPHFEVALAPAAEPAISLQEPFLIAEKIKPIPVLVGTQFASIPQRRAERLLGRSKLALGGALAIGFVIAAALLSRHSSPIPLQAVPLTTYIGDETSPTFSPDESQIAFTWNGEAQDNYDIYALRIGDSAPRRLTKDPAIEYSPAWSPNGQWIAFLRAAVGRGPEVILINPRDGSERRLTEARIVVNPQHDRLDWSADSRWLLLAQRTNSGGPDHIYSISLETGEQRALSSPGAGEFDSSPSLSPDGRLLAFIRDGSQFSSSIVLLPLGPDFRSAGPEHRLDIPGFVTATSLNFPRWASPRELVVNVWSGRQNRRLYRVSISGSKKPEMLGELGEQIGIHALSRSGHKLVFSRGVFDTNIWRFDLATSKENVKRDQRLIASSRFDQQPAISPDGSKIAFETTRTGFSEVWIASRDGSNAVPLTKFEAFAGSPRWSPDGTMIVLDGRRDDHTDADIFVVPAAGGNARRITENPAADFMPSWSVDGRSIYFCSTRTGHEEIWSMPINGGQARRLTFHGGFESVPSPDGQWVYYSKSNSPISSIWRVPSGGGQETMIADDVRSRSFDVTARGLYFLAGLQPSSTDLRLLDFASFKTSTLATFDRFLRDRMSVSRDNDFLLYTRVDQQSNDLMLVERFH